MHLLQNVLIFSNNDEIKRNVICELEKNFEMKTLGDVSTILGIRVSRNYERNTISLDQERYLEDILLKFGMHDANPVKTPIDLNQRISKTMNESEMDTEEENNENFPYREAIGSLLFLAMISRPDITFAVNLLSRFCEKPLNAHWQAVKRVMRYLRGTSKYKLTYGEMNEELKGFCDADWAADVDERRSTTGYVFTMNGGAICRSTKRQHTVALSTTEAEYMSIVAAVQEGIWIRNFLNEIGIIEIKLIKLHGDNKGAIQVATNNNFSERTKHIDIKTKFVKEKIENGEIELNYLPTDSMPADILTKAVPTSKLLKHLPTMGVNNGFTE